MEQKVKKAKKKKEPFENSLKRLQEIVRQMEDGELALEESLQLYEQGVQLTRVCSQKLDEAEKRIEIITRNEQDKLKIERADPELFQHESSDAKGES